MTHGWVHHFVFQLAKDDKEDQFDTTEVANEQPCIFLFRNGKPFAVFRWSTPCTKTIVQSFTTIPSQVGSTVHRGKEGVSQSLTPSTLFRWIKMNFARGSIVLESFIFHLCSIVAMLDISDRSASTERTIPKHHGTAQTKTTPLI